MLFWLDLCDLRLFPCCFFSTAFSATLGITVFGSCLRFLDSVPVASVKSGFSLSRVVVFADTSCGVFICDGDIRLIDMCPLDSEDDDDDEHDDDDEDDMDIW